MKNKRKLKRWVKNTLWVMLGALLGIAIYQLFTVTTIKNTPVGKATCHGGIVKVCNSNKEVAEYLGV